MSNPPQMHGVPATLHRLAGGRLEALEDELCRHVAARPVTLVLPCHVREAGTAALRRIVRELAGAGWIGRIVVGVDGGSAGEAARARGEFDRLPQEVHMLWTGSDAVREFGEALKLPAASGKGRNVWLCAGVALSFGDAHAIAMHDCDIRNFTREIPARLCWPLVHPDAGYSFCKGFYRRHAARLNGRVTRLLVQPLLRALEEVCGAVPIPGFLRAFRYPLAGEAAFAADLLRELPLAGGWGLEAGVLAALSRRPAGEAFCQSELCERYDHKHQELSPGDPARGLHAMAHDILTTLLRALKAAGVRVDGPAADRILAAADRGFAAAMRDSRADALLNGLAFDGEAEALAVRTFAGALESALRGGGGAGCAELPAWGAVFAANPEAAEAVRALADG